MLIPMPEVNQPRHSLQKGELGNLNACAAQDRINEILEYDRQVSEYVKLT